MATGLTGVMEVSYFPLSLLFLVSPKEKKSMEILEE